MNSGNNVSFMGRSWKILITGYLKFDLQEEPEAGKAKFEIGGNVRGIFHLGPGIFGSEAVFVPQQPGT